MVDDVVQRLHVTGPRGMVEDRATTVRVVMGSSIKLSIFARQKSLELRQVALAGCFERGADSHGKLGRWSSLRVHTFEYAQKHFVVFEFR